jgi:hypothetical protein
MLGSIFSEFLIGSHKSFLRGLFSQALQFFGPVNLCGCRHYFSFTPQHVIIVGHGRADRAAIAASAAFNAAASATHLSPSQSASGQIASLIALATSSTDTGVRAAFLATRSNRSAA